MSKKRVDMLKFSSSGGFESSDLELENVLRLPGVGTASSRKNRSSASEPAVSLSASSNFLEEAYAHQQKVQALNDHSKPLAPLGTSLCFLPVNEVVWSYKGACYKGSSTVNPYKRNQDAFVSELDEATDTLLLAVFDGHGQHGDRCASWCQRELPMRLFGHSKWAHDPIAAFKSVCKDLNKVLANPEEASKIFMDTQFSGTTVTAVAIREGSMFVMHLGECRAVLGSARPHLGACGSTISSNETLNKGLSSVEGGAINYDFKDKTHLTATRITVDHRPDDFEERARIIEASGRVFGVSYDDGTIGPARLWLPTMDLPGLTVSRALGDAIGKEFAGLGDEPDFMKVDIEGHYANEQEMGAPRGLGRGDAILILASDGLWEQVSDQEAMDICVNCHGDAAVMTEALVNTAQTRWQASTFRRSDDTTVVVALLCDYLKKWH